MGTWRVPATITGWNGGPGVNVWHLRTGADPGIAGPDHGVQVGLALDALEDFYQAIAGAMRGGLTITVGDELVNVDDGSESPAAAPRTISTGAATDAAPSAAMLCVSWKTSLRARRGMGRTFCGPLARITIDSDGSPTAGVMTQFRSAASALVAASTAAQDWSWGIYGQEKPLKTSQFDENGLPLKVLRDITGSSVSDKFAVLRSRRD